MRLLLGQDIGKQLIDVLGLPKMTRSFELRVAVDEVVTVTCEYHPDSDGLAGLPTAFAAYELVKRASAQPAEPLDFDAWMTQRNEEAHAAMLARHRWLTMIDARLA